MIPGMFFWATKPYRMGSAPKGKNLLRQEQILFFKSWPPFKKEAKLGPVELLPLKVYRHLQSSMVKLEQVELLPLKVYRHLQSSMVKLEQVELLPLKAYPFTFSLPR